MQSFIKYYRHARAWVCIVYGTTGKEQIETSDILIVPCIICYPSKWTKWSQWSNDQPNGQPNGQTEPNGQPNGQSNGQNEQNGQPNGQSNGQRNGQTEPKGQPLYMTTESEREICSSPFRWLSITFKRNG